MGSNKCMTTFNFCKFFFSSFFFSLFFGGAGGGGGGGGRLGDIGGGMHWHLKLNYHVVWHW